MTPSEGKKQTEDWDTILESLTDEKAASRPPKKRSSLHPTPKKADLLGVP